MNEPHAPTALLAALSSRDFERFADVVPEGISHIDLLCSGLPSDGGTLMGHGLRSLSLVAVMLAMPIAALAAFPGTAAAAVGSTWGYAWANLPTTTDYTPTTAYQRQSNGQHASVHRNGTGDYVVTFPGIASPTSGGVVQVTAYDTNGACQSDGWFNSGSNVVASVICFARARFRPICTSMSCSQRARGPLPWHTRGTTCPPPPVMCRRTGRSMARAARSTASTRAPATTR